MLDFFNDPCAHKVGRYPLHYYVEGTRLCVYARAVNERLREVNELLWCPLRDNNGYVGSQIVPTTKNNSKRH